MTKVAPSTLPDSEYRGMELLLRGGLLASLSLLVVALVAYAVTHSALTVARAIAANPILGFLGALGLFQGLSRGDPAAFLTLGLIVLVATPILRVAAGFYYSGGAGSEAWRRSRSPCSRSCCSGSSSSVR